jgi:adenine-specific DNA methylase
MLVEELQRLRPEIVKVEGNELGEAAVHLLAFVIDKFAAYNGIRSRWHCGSVVIAPAFDRHDFSFKPAFAEMAPCGPGAGLAWAIDNTLEAYEHLAELVDFFTSGSSARRCIAGPSGSRVTSATTARRGW